jgi:hypothetical protein
MKPDNFYCHSLRFWPGSYLPDLSAVFCLEGKEIGRRHSRRASADLSIFTQNLGFEFIPILQWATLILVNQCIDKIFSNLKLLSMYLALALSFPVKFSGV